MTQCDIAIQFIERFCAADVDGVEELLSPTLEFSGPFHQFDNRQDYIDSLRQDPPQPARYELLSVTDNETEVAIFYNYLKEQMPLLFAQLFHFNPRRQIGRIVLVFDGRI
jgi:hypothetical protein